MSLLRVLAGSMITFVILAIGAVVMFFVALVTLFRARRIYSEYIAKWLAQIVLRQWGIRCVVHRDYPLPEKQFVYVSNHTGTLDVFTVIAMGLPNCRYFLRGFIRAYLPIWVMGVLMGTFFTVHQKYPEKRRKIFHDAARTLEKTGESVFLTPEGERVTTGEIGHFNKGAFHLATQLKAPIVPFYLATPKETDPGRSFNVNPGTVHIYFKDIINTNEWLVEDVVVNAERVRNKFLIYHEDYKPE